MRIVIEGETRWWDRRAYRRARRLLKGRLEAAAAWRLRVSVSLESVPRPAGDGVRCVVTVSVAGHPVLRCVASDRVALGALEAALAPLAGWLGAEPVPWTGRQTRAMVPSRRGP